jgi:hypothetical protein
LPTVQLCSGFGWGTHLGVTTGNAGNKVADGVTGTLGTTITWVAGATPDGTGYGVRVGASSQIGWNTDSLGTGKTTFVGHVWVKLSVDPSTDKDILTQDTALLVGDVGFTYLIATDKIHAYNGASTADSVLNYPPGSGWVLLQWEYFCGAGTHTLKWSLDGVLQTQVDRTKTSTTIATVDLGGAGGTGGSFDYAWPVFSTTSGDYPLGPHRVATRSVDPAGTVVLSGTSTNFQTFTANGTTAAWNATTARNNTDDVPVVIGASADGAMQIATAATEYMEFPMTPLTLGTGERVDGLRLEVPGWASSTTAATIGFRSWNGTTETTLQAGTVDPNFDNSTTAPAWVCKMLTLADFDTQAELDAMTVRVGFSSNGGQKPGVHGVFVSVAIALDTIPTLHRAVHR